MIGFTVVPDVVISREVTPKEVADAVRAGMGAGVEVMADETSVAVRQGQWKRARVIMQSGAGSTTLRVKGGAPPGLLVAIVGLAVNARFFAPEVADAVKRGLG